MRRIILVLGLSLALVGPASAHFDEEDLCSKYRRYVSCFTVNQEHPGCATLRAQASSQEGAVTWLAMSELIWLVEHGIVDQSLFVQHMVPALSTLLTLRCSTHGGFQ